jgi:hypothetical protein
MGYTHYWSRKEWDDTTAGYPLLCQAATDIFDYATKQGIALAGAHGEPNTQREINVEHILFNGVGKDSHETFYWPRKAERPEWQRHYPALSASATITEFCKTNYKPYDVVVLAMLAAADLIYGGIRFESDGGKEVLETGLNFLYAACPNFDELLEGNDNE